MKRCLQIIMIGTYLLFAFGFLVNTMVIMKEWPQCPKPECLGGLMRAHILQPENIENPGGIVQCSKCHRKYILEPGDILVKEKVNGESL